MSVDKNFSKIITNLKNDEFSKFSVLLDLFYKRINKNIHIYKKSDNYKFLKNTLFRKLDENKANNNYVLILKFIFKYLDLYDYNNLEFYKETANNLYNLKLYDFALSIYFKCLKFENYDKDILRIIADIFYYNKKENLKAIEFYEKYIEYNKTNHLVYNILGVIYSNIYKSKYTDKQIEYFEKAHKLCPDEKLYIRNLVIIAGKNKDVNRFKKYSDIILSDNPTHLDYFTSACWGMYNGLFDLYHKYFHHRFFLEKGATEYPEVEKKLWNGNDLKDEKLLVRFEQGFGDSIMFIRFLPLLKDKVSNLTFKVQWELLSLFRYNS